MGSGLSEEFLVQVGVYQEFSWFPLIFAILVDVITKYLKEGLISEILYTDDLALVSEYKENLREKFLTRSEAFERKELKVNLKKTKVMVNS